MIKQLKGLPILKGAKGHKPVVIDATADIITKVATLTGKNPEIGEIDLNPVFPFEDGAPIVNARIILSNA